MRAALLVALWGGAVLAAPPALLLEGRIVWTLPAGAPALTLTASVGGRAGGWDWTGSLEFADGAWKALKFAGSGRLGALELSPSLALDPQRPGFSGLTLPWQLNALGLALEGVARLEERGFGWGLTLSGPKDGFVERVRLRFNLKRFADEVHEDTFSPSFTYGEVRFRLTPLCCAERARGWVSLTKAGFSELGVSFPLPFPREMGLLASAVVRLAVDKKDVFLGPGFFYELPPCVEAFLGLDWDPNAWAIRGIEVYAVGFRCQLGGVAVRGLAQFQPIGLVKEPYREALWISWEGQGCGGPAKLTAAVHFGEAGSLFGLGEVEICLEAPAASGASFGFGIRAPVSGEPTLTLSWKLRS